MCSYFFTLTLVLLEFLFVTSQTTLIYFSIISIMEELVVPFSSFPTTLSFLWKKFLKKQKQKKPDITPKKYHSKESLFINMPSGDL